MAQIEFNNSVVRYSPATFRGTLTQVITGDESHTTTSTKATCSSDTMHADYGFMPFNKTYYCRTTFVCDEICAGTKLKFESGIRDFSLRLYSTKIIEITQAGTYVIKQSWNGVSNPTPTYLETLDKLDQWSHAQYIPNSMDKLNL